jgi:hypothetical protein
VGAEPPQQPCPQPLEKAARSTETITAWLVGTVRKGGLSWTGSRGTVLSLTADRPAEEAADSARHPRLPLSAQEPCKGAQETLRALRLPQSGGRAATGRLGVGPCALKPIRSGQNIPAGAGAIYSPGLRVLRARPPAPESYSGATGNCCQRPTTRRASGSTPPCSAPGCKRLQAAGRKRASVVFRLPVSRRPLPPSSRRFQRQEAGPVDRVEPLHTREVPGSIPGAPIRRGPGNGPLSYPQAETGRRPTPLAILVTALRALTTALQACAGTARERGRLARLRFTRYSPSTRWVNRLPT